MKAPLLVQRRFFPLWLAVSLGALNDNMLRQALIIGLVYGALAPTGFSDPADAIPFIGAMFSAATLACTAIAGQVAEKYESARLLRRIKLFEVALMALAGVGFFLKSGLLLMAVLIAMSAQTAFFNPARAAAMPKYLQANELTRANAFCNAGMFAAIVAGLVLGGVLIAAPGGWMAVSALLLGAALASWVGVLSIPPAPAEAPRLTIDWNPLGQTVRTLGYAFAEAGVWRPLAGVAFFYVVTTVTTILIPLYAIEELGANGAAATALMGLSAIGAGVGALGAAGRASRRSGLGFSFAGIVGASAATLAIYALTGPVAASGASRTIAQIASHGPGLLLLAAFMVSSGFMGLYLAPLQAAAQRRAPAGKRARALAAGHILNALCAMAAALGVFTITNTPLSPADGLVVLAVMQGALGLYMLRRWFALPHGFYDEKLRAEAPPRRARAPAGGDEQAV